MATNLSPDYGVLEYVIFRMSPDNGKLFYFSDCEDEEGMRGLIFGNETFELYPLPPRMMDLFER